MPWEPTLGCHLDDSHMHEMAGNQNVDIIYLGTCISSTWVSGLRISPRGYGPSAAPSYPGQRRRLVRCWFQYKFQSVQLARLSPRFAQNTAYFRRFSLEKAVN